MKTLLKNFADLFFPRRCRICLTIFNHGPSNWVCHGCLGNIGYLHGPVCEICGKPFFLDYKTSEYCCGDCMENSPPYNLLRSFGPYAGVLRKMIYSFKYNHLPGLADDLSGFLIDYIKNNRFPKDFEVIFCVPFHRKKLMERGFDPAYLLARNVAVEFNVPLPVNALVKIRETDPQVSLSRKERLKNVKGTFSFEGECNLIKGKKVLLLDDVSTTGATLRECSAVLKANGAEKVFCLTVARA